MDIFGVGFPELVLIFLIALMILGPRRLPEYAAKAGKFVRDMRNMSQGLMTEWRREVMVAARLEELEETRLELQEARRLLQETHDTVTSETSQAKTEVSKAISETKKAAAETPKSPPQQDLTTSETNHSEIEDAAVSEQHPIRPPQNPEAESEVATTEKVINE